MAVADWIKRDAGQLVSGLIQTLVFVALSTWYVGGRIAEIDQRAALQEEKLTGLRERIDQVETASANYRSELLAEVRGMRNDLRNDLIRLQDRIDNKFNGRPPP